MHEYRAYGLNLRSELALSGLTPSRGEPDVEVRFGQVEIGETRPMLNGGGRRRVSGSEACLAYDNVGVILIREGREIVLRPEPGSDQDSLAPFVLGPGLGMILLQRGVLALHASAVGLRGAASIFLGGPGWGKSTTAAALERRGHRLIADDISSITRDRDEHVVQPGFPTLKLSSESAAALGHDFDEMHELHTVVRKRGRTVESSFDDAPLPLRRVYVLAEGDAIRIEPISGAAALGELVRHSYGAPLIRETGLAAAHLRQCADLAGSVPIRRLTRPLSFDRIADLAEAIELDALNGAHG